MDRWVADEDGPCDCEGDYETGFPRGTDDARAPSSQRRAPPTPPPAQATYATAPAFFAFREEAPGARTCVQRAGDVLFVPNNWGHAVLNLRTSVGVAAELSFLEL